LLDKNALNGLALLHDLVPFLPIDRLHALLNNTPLPTVTSGAALFADISGFTALEEQLTLELGQERGAEELNQRINRTFVGLIDIVDRYHGSVIRFSGDALTAWFTGQAAALRAATAGLAMQAMMKALTATLPALHLKIGVSSGMTRRFRPGDPALGVYEVLAGPPVEQMIDAEARAQPGQVILTPEAATEIGDNLGGEWLPDGFKRLDVTVFAARPPGSERWPSIRWLDHLDRAWALVEACRPYLLAPIYERLVSGHGAYVTDLRTVSTLFVRFSGLDYDSPTAEEQLDQLVRTAQRLIMQHGGYLNEVGAGDKGNMLVALFGAPVALEAPAVQAAHCALALREELPYIGSVHCGLTSDEVFTGTVGSPMRRAYAAIGGSVILAARLMSLAGPDEILADARTPQAVNDCAWEALPPMRVKGRVAPVSVHRLLGLAEITRPVRPIGVFMGRVNELRALAWALEGSRDGQARALLLKGEAGLGKSHLLQEFVAMVRDRGITWLSGAGRSAERQVPYRPWRDIFTRYFELDRHASLPARQEQVRARLAQISEDVVFQAPLLNDVLHLRLPENEWTSFLKPDQRHRMLTLLLVALLRAWLDEEPLALTIDEAHWLDPLSWEVLFEAMLNLKNQPLVVLVAMRPLENEPPRALQLLEDLPHVRQFWLAPLSVADSLAMAAEHLGVETLPDSLAQLIVEKAGGNPFFIQEIVSVLRDSGIVRIVNGQAVLAGSPATLHLPNTVQDLVRSRIDRLPPDQQILLKVAAVIGPQFTYRALRGVQPLNLSDADLRANLEALAAVGIRRTDTLNGDTAYTFHNITTREVAYGMLAFSQRRQLHRAVAQWLEQEHQEHLALYYPALVHHWRLAEDADRERHYCRLAGAQSATQYMNDDAAAYLERALELTPGNEPAALYEILLQLESIYHLRAERVKQRLALIGLTALANGQQCVLWQAEAGVLWARHYESVAEYEHSLEAAQAAYVAAEQAGSHRLMGLSNVYWGLALVDLARYQEAQARLSTGIAEQDDAIEARRLNILGSSLSAQGEHAAAQTAFEEALKYSRAATDRAGIAQTLSNLGDNYARMSEYEQAIRCHEEAVAIRLSMGDRQGVATTFYNLGLLALHIGDYETAQHDFEQARVIFEMIDDRNGEALTTNGIGRLAYQRGDYAVARSCFTHALEIRRAIGDRPGIRDSLIDLGLVEVALGRTEEAEAIFGDALAADQDLGKSAQVASVFAAWGQLALRLGDLTAAQFYTQTAMNTIEKHGGLARLDEPFQVSLSCYEILTACGEHTQARAMLQQAYDLLMARAAQITDTERHARYLMTVPAHRQIVALMEKQQRPPDPAP